MPRVGGVQIIFDSYHRLDRMWIHAIRIWSKHFDQDLSTLGRVRIIIHFQGVFFDGRVFECIRSWHPCIKSASAKDRLCLIGHYINDSTAKAVTWQRNKTRRDDSIRPCITNPDSKQLENWICEKSEEQYGNWNKSLSYNKPWSSFWITEPANREFII